MTQKTIYTKIAGMVRDSDEENKVPLADALALIEEAAMSESVTEKEFKSKSLFAAIFLRGSYQDD